MRIGGCILLGVRSTIRRNKLVSHRQITNDLVNKPILCDSLVKERTESQEKASRGQGFQATTEVKMHIVMPPIGTNVSSK